MNLTPYRILIIKPRWYLMKVLETECENVRSAHPDAELYVLAAEEIVLQNVIAIKMLDIRRDSKFALLNSALSLRRIYFNEVTALADDARSEAGYLEVKIWAFIARGNTRRLGNMRQLRFSEELKDKWRRIVVQKAVEKFIRLYHSIDVRLHPAKKRFEDNYDNGENIAQTRLKAFIKKA